MEPIGVGIIGAGSIAGAHASAWMTFSDRCQLLAFADIDATRAQERAEQFGAPMWFTDPEEMLRRDDIQVVSICTPPFTHAELAIAALEAGKHVLVEKPMCCSLEEADRMIAMASKGDRLLGVVFQWRSTIEFQRMKALLEEKKLGRLILAHMVSLWWRTVAYFQVWWRGTWEKECGGSLISHAIHHLDLLLALMGDPVRVSAEAGVYAHPIETEDALAATLRFKDGALGVILSSTATYPQEYRLTIYGELGSVTMPWRLNAVDPNYQSELEEWISQIPRPEHGGHIAIIIDFLDALQGGRRPLVDGQEGRRSIELAIATYKSALTGEPVTLPLSPDDPFYTKEGLMAAVKRRQRGETG